MRRLIHESPGGSARRPSTLVGLAVCYSTLLFSLIGCGIAFGPNAEAAHVVVKSESVELAWDPPARAGTFGPLSYRIYYAEHGTEEWILLREIEAGESPSFVVEYDQVGKGVWNFAVQAVYPDGRRSPMHTSLDLTAEPIGGWYVNWIPQLQ